MANIILKLVPNKWDPKYFFAFIKASEKNPKNRHFLAYNSFKHPVLAGEFWECFIVSKRELKERVLVKVVPFKRIDLQKLAEEKRRVGRFNKELEFMEKLVGADFDKIIYKRDNIPFLQAKRDAQDELARKYPSLVFTRDLEGLLARPSEKLFARPPRPGGFRGGFRPPQRPFERSSPPRSFR